MGNDTCLGTGGRQFKSGHSDTVDKLKNPSIFRGVFYYMVFVHTYSILITDGQGCPRWGVQNKLLIFR